MKIRSSLTILLLFLISAGSVFGRDVRYVIHISVDGGGSSYIQALINSDKLPNFKRLRAESAGTFNARTDYDITVTLPNHVTQATGRGILGDNGHNWTSNTDPAKGKTIHSQKGSYIASVFDVAHDNGLRTIMYAGKTKFSLFDTSYNAANGAIDLTGEDNGRGKLDDYVYNSDSAILTDNFIAAMQSKPCNYVFFHYADPDTAGHTSGWGSANYNNALIAIDGYLGRILKLATSDSTLKGKTLIVLTADHGGNGKNHANADDPLDYTIPFLVWGLGVTAGADLYALNSASRLDPGACRPPYTASGQPIRNGDAPNLELKFLGLPPVPGSTINCLQNFVSFRDSPGKDNQPTSSTTRRFGPWTPRIRVFSMSEVRLGPVTITNSPLSSRSAKRRATVSQAAGRCSAN